MVVSCHSPGTDWRLRMQSPYMPETAGTSSRGSYYNGLVSGFLTSPPTIQRPVRQPEMDPTTRTPCVAGTHSASDHLFGIEKCIMDSSVCTYPLPGQLSVHARRTSSMHHPL